MSADGSPPSGAPPEGAALPGFVAVAPGTRRIVELAARAAARAANVLIIGETGVGKGCLARAMHDAGRGVEAPFVTIDCGSLPEGLAESELFGHEADAFSGAVGRKAGKFELADRGTVLLDRVEDLPPEVQAKLLRVLEERAFERVGGQATLRVDARVIATSSADLPALVSAGRLREDLYYRLHVVQLELPPLRDRTEDVPELARVFVAEGAVGAPPRLTRRAEEFLARQSWPGNVRQLRNVLERAVALTEGSTLNVDDLLPAFEGPRTSPDRAIAALAESGLSLAELESLYIARLMKQVGGRVGRAAEILGIHRKTLLEKRKRYGLD